jgi:hypothetical protein
MTSAITIDYTPSNSDDDVAITISMRGDVTIAGTAIAPEGDGRDCWLSSDLATADFGDADSDVIDALHNAATLGARGESGRFVVELDDDTPEYEIVALVDWGTVDAADSLNDAMEEAFSADAASDDEMAITDLTVRQPRNGEAAGTYYRNADGSLQIMGYTVGLPGALQYELNRAWGVANASLDE